MNKTDYQGMCQLFGDGELIWLENLDSHSKGRLTGCKENMLEVDVKGHRELWKRDSCSELTHGYKVKYEEIIKHPHEYDTHLD